MELSPDQTYALQATGLTKRFGKFTAVDRIDLAIRKGELFALLGKNGAGKTTTLKMLACLLKPTNGNACVMGYNVLRHAMHIKKIMNISPQETAIARNLSVHENLILMARLYGMSKARAKDRADEMMLVMGLKEKAASRAKNLSGGMQRRLSLAMALVTDPEILFLDEPTLGLDPGARRELWKFIDMLKGRKTVILTTHYLEEADQLADRIAILSSGKIAASGTPAELKLGYAGQKKMIVRSAHFSEQSIRELQKIYPDVKARDNELVISSVELSFDIVVDCLRANGVQITWLSMMEASLDEVFVNLENHVAP